MLLSKFKSRQNTCVDGRRGSPRLALLLRHGLFWLHETTLFTDLYQWWLGFYTFQLLFNPLRDRGRLFHLKHFKDALFFLLKKFELSRLGVVWPRVQNLAQKWLVFLQKHIFNLFPSRTLCIKCKSNLDFFLVLRSEGNFLPFLETSNSLWLEPVNEKIRDYPLKNW